MGRRAALKAKLKLSPHRRQKPGASPGLLSAPPDAPKPVVRFMSYDATSCDEREVEDVSVLADARDGKRVLWVDVQGVGDVEVVRRIGELFGFHPLALEDVLNVHQRPKVDTYTDHLYCVLRMPEHTTALRLEQISMFLGKDYVITFQEDPGDPLDPVRDRIRQARGKIRTLGSDYLAYAILDAIVDQYFPVLESFAERIDTLEDQVLAASGSEVVSLLQDIRRELLLLRRAVWPLRDTIGAFAREECQALVRDTTIPYLRDCQDHASQLVDVLESCRELAHALMDAYMSAVALRTNDVMRVLTIMSTIFIPLTFIAGVYGMNFDPAASPLNMPELRWYFGYPLALGSMVATAVGLVYFFHTKGWLGTTRALRVAEERRDARSRSQ